MHLYQNKISVIKYFNSDDTIKTKRCPERTKMNIQILNYYALKLFGITNVRTHTSLKRHPGSKNPGVEF